MRCKAWGHHLHETFEFKPPPLVSNMPVLCIVYWQSLILGGGGEVAYCGAGYDLMTILGI